MRRTAELLSKDPTNLALLWEKAKEIYKELKVTGLSDMAIAGILGNMALESSFIPNKKGGKHIGYVQNLPEIVDWIIQHFGGYDYTHQLNYLKAGLTNNLPDITSTWGDDLNKRFNTFLTGIQKIKTPAEAVTLWESAYEKANGQDLLARINYGNFFYDKILEELDELQLPEYGPMYSPNGDLSIYLTVDPPEDLTNGYTKLMFEEIHRLQLARLKNLPKIPFKKSYAKGGKLIKKGQSGMYINRTGPYNTEIYLEKDPLPADYVEPKNIGKYGYVHIPAEARMDLTTLLLNERLSTYKPTKELLLASYGIAHPTHWYNYLSLVPIVLPAAGVAAATAPEWGPAALTTVSNPTFWGELLKDTGAYIAADATSRGLTGKGIGAHVNNAIGLEEDHPVGELLSFSTASPTKNLIRKGVNFTKLILRPTPALNSPLIIRVILPNGKIRVRLSSHTDEMPREIVLEPLGNNKYYAHIRTWDDVNRKIPANLSQSDINLLYEAFYNELPEGAEVLVPESGPGNYATRGTIAGLKRLARDTRFSPGKKGKVLYDDNGKIKTYKTTSFIKNLPVDEDYINRQLIPLAEQQGNWQGHTPITSNIPERTTFLSNPKIPFAGLFNGSRYYVNTFVGPELTLPTYLHEIRHGLDFSIKYNSFTGANPIRRFLKTNPLYMFKKGTYRPIQLTKKQIKLLNKAYPTKFKIPLLTGRQMTEKIAVNAEMRYLFDNLYYKTFGKKPTVEQLNNFINILPDDIFVETLFGSRSGYMHTYMSNIVKPLSKAEGTFTIHTPPSPIDGTSTIKVNKNVLGSESIKRMKQAITSVPSITGIGYGIYNTQQTQ